MWWCVGLGCATRFESQRSEALRLQNGVKTRWVRLCLLPLSLLLAQRRFPGMLPTTPYHTALGYAATKPSINSADVSWQVIFTNHETYGKRETTDSSQPHPSYPNPAFFESTAAHPPARKREREREREIALRHENRLLFRPTRIFRGDEPSALRRTHCYVAITSSLSYASRNDVVRVGRREDRSRNQDRKKKRKKERMKTFLFEREYVRYV